jgi:hypothetical protein
VSSRSANSSTCERDNWNYYQGNGRRKQIRRGKLKKKFKAMQKDGVTAKAVALWMCARKKGESVHPDSFAFLLRYGTEFTERSRWEKPPSWGEPARKRCFGNSALLMRSHANYLAKHPGVARVREHAFVYVEGIAYGPVVNPMAHAWNATGLRSNKAIDWTFYAVNNRTTYLGLKLTSDEYEELCECIYPWLKSGLNKQPRYKRGKRPHHIQVFNTEYFGRIDFRLLLTTILQRRKKAGKKKPILKGRT